MIRKARRYLKKRGRDSHLGRLHRGGGNRGGHGNAGAGKKTGGQKKSKYIKLGIKLGHFGFHNPTAAKVKAINVGELEKYAEKGVVDTKKLGYNKVLGKGNVKQKLTVKAEAFSKQAKAKIEKAGGQASTE